MIIVSCKKSFFFDVYRGKERHLHRLAVQEGPTYKMSYLYIVNEKKKKKKKKKRY